MAKFRDSGFAKVRRGILEHLQDEKIGLGEFSVYMLVLLNADPSTGAWIGSARKLADRYLMSERTCRDNMEKLEEKGYIKRFQIPGKHASYPILINRFEVTDGAARGRFLNATESHSYKDLKYYSAAAGAAMSAGESAGAGADKYLEKLEKREKDTLPRGKRVVDSRHSIFKDILERYWKFANTTLPEMPWSGREAKALDGLLSASPTLDAGAFLKLLNNRRLSEVNHSDPVYLWIRDVAKYEKTIDRFGKPLGGNYAAHLGNSANRSQARTDGNLEAAKRAITRLYGDDGPVGGEAQGEPERCDPSGLLDHAGPVQPAGCERGS